MSFLSEIPRCCSYCAWDEVQHKKHTPWLKRCCNRRDVYLWTSLVFEVEKIVSEWEHSGRVRRFWSPYGKRRLKERSTTHTNRKMISITSCLWDRTVKTYTKICCGELRKTKTKLLVEKVWRSNRLTKDLSFVQQKMIWCEKSPVMRPQCEKQADIKED